MTTVRENIKAGKYSPDLPYVSPLYKEAELLAEITFRMDLEQEFKTKGNKKATKLFSLAWEYGHSAGFDEVLTYYEDMADLIK